MSRQPGEPMRKLLALHEEWRAANGYPLQVSREKKTKLYKLRHRRAPQPTSEISKNKSTGASGARLEKSLKFLVSQKV
tara:strand:+ start:759 stop:992 length:234 start_codon:yes stop_codon:yes gene_type:complete